MSDAAAFTPPTATPPTATGRVLVAEDEEHLGALLAQFLRGRGLDVTLVRDGSAAVAALAAGDYDAVVVDVQMPGADGFQVLAAARSALRPAEVVVATGNATRETALAALRGGAHGTVAKPYRMAEVELVVQRALETRRLRDELIEVRRERDALRAALSRSPEAGGPPPARGGRATAPRAAARSMLATRRHETARHRG